MIFNRYRTSDNSQFYGLSINDTLKALLRVGDLKLAEKFRNEYKIPEKRHDMTRFLGEFM